MAGEPLSGLVVVPEEAGYRRPAGAVRLRLSVQRNRWLAAEGLRPADLVERMVERFRREHVN